MPTVCQRTGRGEHPAAEKLLTVKKWAAVVCRLRLGGRQFGKRPFRGDDIEKPPAQVTLGLIERGRIRAHQTRLGLEQRTGSDAR